MRSNLPHSLVSEGGGIRVRSEIAKIIGSRCQKGDMKEATLKSNHHSAA